MAVSVKHSAIRLYRCNQSSVGHPASFSRTSSRLSANYLAIKIKNRDPKVPIKLRNGIQA